MRRYLIIMLTASLLIFGCRLQEKLLYYPDRRVPSDSELAQQGMRFWPSGREGYRGFVGMEPAGAAKGTVLVFHGNAATAADRAYYLEPLRRFGYRVLLAEYPGYGGRPGRLGEESFRRDAIETIRLARQEYGKPLYLLGESLGGGVAASAIGEGGTAIEGVILVTPWETLEKIAREKFPWLPVRLLMTDRYDNPGNLRMFRGPVAVVGAQRDTIIPPGHAEALYRSLPGRKRFWIIPGADHNDWPFYIGEATWGEIMRFLLAQG